MSELSELPNVGKVLERLLHEVGISTPAQLRELGAREAFLRIRIVDPTACLHMLYGVQGAVDGISDRLLSQSVKDELKAFFKSL